MTAAPRTPFRTPFRPLFRGGAAAAALALAAAGCADADPPATGEPSTPPSARASDGERVAYRGVSLLLPPGWTSRVVTDSFGSLAGPEEDLVEEEWTVLYPDAPECADVGWTWTENSTGCAHLKVLGPLGLEHGGSGYAPVSIDTLTPGSSYTASGDPAPCPEGVPTLEGETPGPDSWETGDRAAGPWTAGYGVGPTACYDGSTGGFAYFEQRLWILDEPGVLVVDNYGLPDAEDVVASVRPA
ncbi:MULTISPECIES: hypothetical protein [unclassified Nocardiopsis]|uniref:hypothetical protein n=1 Tax=Nocardiopsis TaxID=2013 RepID=UPI00387B5C8B